MELENDKDRAILAMVITKSWKDKSFKKSFLEDPKTVLRNEGLEIPDSVKIKAVEDTSEILYIPLSQNVDVEEHKDQLLALLKIIIPIAKDREISWVRSSENQKYVKVPKTPSEEEMEKIDSVNLLNKAADSGVEATLFNNTTQTVEVETTVIAVAEITGVTLVEIVENSVAVVAEGAIVLI